MVTIHAFSSVLIASSSTRLKSDNAAQVQLQLSMIQ